MIPQEEFLKKYNIKDDDFASTGLKWSDLEAIYKDHAAKQSDLIPAGNLVSEHLRQIPQVHSLKMRIKDPEHLVEKIIRKRIEGPGRDITLANYETEITDLIGVRALHLFKEGWVHIHEAITSIWENHQTPVANIRKGDPEDMFTKHGLEISPHPAGYRSVHYTIKLQPTKKVILVEIQVRTIFEEGWSEIDHQLRYPYEVENQILCDYLAILNRFAGAADEMGSYIRWLKRELEHRDAANAAAIKAHENEKAKMIADLESVKKKLASESNERKKLQKTIDSLHSAPPPTLPSQPGSGYIGFSGFGTQTCGNCGQSYNSALLTCPHCATSGILGLGQRSCTECGKPIPFTHITMSGRCADCDRTSLLGVSNNKICRQCGKSYAGKMWVVDDGRCESCKPPGLY